MRASRRCTLRCCPISEPFFVHVHIFPVQVAIAGEALIDLIGRADGNYEPCLGGALYNLARALARQGVGTQYLNPLSRDRWGRELAAQLAADGVQLALPTPVGEVTSLAVVNLTEHGHPDYAFYREGVADRTVSAAGLNAACAAHGGVLQLVCTGALALDARDAAIYLPWLQAQRAAGRCVVVDANLRPSVMPDLPAYRAQVQAALAEAHIIKASDEDLDHLQVPGTEPLERARATCWLPTPRKPHGPDPGRRRCLAAAARGGCSPVVCQGSPTPGRGRYRGRGRQLSCGSAR